MSGNSLLTRDTAPRGAPEPSERVGAASATDRTVPDPQERVEEPSGSRQAGDRAAVDSPVPLDDPDAPTSREPGPTPHERPTAESPEPEPGDATPVLCSCGAAQSADDPRRCARGHQWAATTGIRLDEGVYAGVESLPVAPTGDIGAHHIRLMDRLVERMVSVLDTRQPSLKDLPRVERVFDVIERRRGLAERLARSLSGGGSATRPYADLSDEALDAALVGKIVALGWIRPESVDDLTAALLGQPDIRRDVMRRLASADPAIASQIAGMAPEDDDDPEGDLIL